MGSSQNGKPPYSWKKPPSFKVKKYKSAILFTDAGFFEVSPHGPIANPVILIYEVRRSLRRWAIPLKKIHVTEKSRMNPTEISRMNAHFSWTCLCLSAACTRRIWALIWWILIVHSRAWSPQYSIKSSRSLIRSLLCRTRSLACSTCSIARTSLSASPIIRDISGVLVKAGASIRISNTLSYKYTALNRSSGIVSFATFSLWIMSAMSSILLSGDQPDSNVLVAFGASIR